MPKIELIEIHMAAAHFPIALLMSNVFFDVVGRLWNKTELRITSYWIHLLGFVSALFTIGLGSVGNPFLKDVGLIGNPWRDYGHAMTQKAVQHSWIGMISILIFGALSVWRIKKKDAFSKLELTIYLLITGMGITLLGLTGYLGSHVMD